MFREISNQDSREPQACFKGVSQGRFKEVSRLFKESLICLLGNFKKVSGVFQECFNKVLQLCCCIDSSQLPEQKESVFKCGLNLRPKF